MQETIIYNAEDQNIPEQRLWRAVIASTVAEWVSGPLTKSREAEQFLFHDDKDYRTVCFSAGINPDNLRTQLEKHRISKSAELIEAASRN